VGILRKLLGWTRVNLTTENAVNILFVLACGYLFGLGLMALGAALEGVQ
jgi:hypothetical protein